ncbi:MAG TPA: hypothetical protein VGO41_08490 [Steroidobacteraceae bacterium]|jgi:hypothetical protein|nr:hypothetical protein [Steroidobacteraceae bacterium]
MKTSARTLTALVAAFVIPLGTLAAEPETPATTAESSPATETPAADAKATDAKATDSKATHSKARKADTKCEQSTSSRIRKNKGDCDKDSQPTSSYSKEELESTGQTDTADALRRLDPRVH